MEHLIGIAAIYLLFLASITEAYGLIYKILVKFVPLLLSFGLGFIYLKSLNIL